MFQLTKEEFEELRPILQFVISPKGGGIQKHPFIFTEQEVVIDLLIDRTKPVKIGFKTD